MLLHEEIEARGYLEETIDHDNNPDTEEIPRREAYVRMFEQGRAHVTSDPGRRIANQELANRTAMYVLNEALKKLEPEKAWSEEYILDDLYEATGTKPNSDAVRPYTVSPKGLGIEGLSYTDVGGFDANYGPHSVRFVSDLAKWTQDRELIERARTLTNAFAHYYSLTNNGDGDTVLIRNEAVSWRNNSMPGRVTYNPDPYVALQLQEPVALRQLHLYIQHGGAYGLNFESHNAHWLATLYEHLDLLEELDHELVNVSGKDARYARQLVNAFKRSGEDAGEVNTRLLNRFKPDDVLLPMEEASPDYAWADEVAGTVVIKHEGDRMYLTPGWRGMEYANNIARVHYTTDTLDRVANMAMSSPFGLKELYIVKYGNYVVIMNSSLEETYDLHFEGEFETALDLITDQEVDLSATQTMDPLTTMVLYLGE
jgi:hypothetical protein